MKIEHSQANRIAQKQAESAAGLEKNQRPAEMHTDALAGKDQANLSERARLLAKARTELAELPEVRAEKVADLRQQVDNGTYQVPIEKLVKRLLSQFTE